MSNQITTTGSRSSMNAIRHGLLAKCTVLPNESREAFQVLLDDFIHRVRPTDPVELAIAEEMASAVWRLRRLWAIEVSVLAAELETQPAGDELTRLASAFTSLAENSNRLALIHRYETRLHKLYARALHNLVLLRAAVPNENTSPGGNAATVVLSALPENPSPHEEL